MCLSTDETGALVLNRDPSLPSVPDIPVKPRSQFVFCTRVSVHRRDRYTCTSYYNY